MTVSDIATPENIYALILAGGLGSRMGSTHKPTATLGSSSLVQRVIDRVKPQATECLLSISQDDEHLSKLQLRCIKDRHSPARGPLEGLLSAMLNLKDLKSPCRWLLSVPTDCPFIPLDLAERLAICLLESKYQVSFARYKTDNHYLCGLWSIDCADAISRYLDGDNYSVRGLLKQLDAVACDFGSEAQDPFFNINTLEDLSRAENRLNS